MTDAPAPTPEPVATPTAEDASMSQFSACLAFTLAEEGGFSDDPSDPGGATNYGITLATLSHWRGRQCTVDDVRALTQREAGAIYRVSYWHAMKCGALPYGLDLMTFDEGVNAGAAASVRMLQFVLGVEADGIVGAHTLSAAEFVKPLGAISALADRQEESYRADAGFDVFGAGWLARLTRREALAMRMAKGLNQ